ncbi:MAG: helix-hairpin-helix domain-containing protein [Bacteroidota bacterium]|nr:helix-hairpin-helix domain-containing protein [Bacteroidota bacterium]
MWKQFAKAYFSFTLKERRATVLIVSLIFIIVMLGFLYPLFIKNETFNHSEFENEIAKLEVEKSDTAKYYSKNNNNELYDDYTPNENKKYKPVKSEVFYFDPNTVSAEDWKRLGIRDKTIHTIQNYLSKGGKFYKPEDISKIWGMSPTDIKRLTPYVSIKKVAAQYPLAEKKEYNKTASYYPSKTVSPIDINLADTSAFISLPGIGSKLASRIIAFRQKLGGFYSLEQVSETYLLPDSTFQKIKSRLVLNNVHLKQININNTTIDEMKTHPYIRYYLANAIFQYKQQHGNFNSVEDIKKIMLVTDAIYEKLSPYLTAQ